jgi:uncharacterized membrane protein YqaE (UPF0057 family)
MMYYLLAIILPPAAVFLCGRRGQTPLNLILTLCLWVPGVIHALAIVHGYLGGQRTNHVGQHMRQHRMNSLIRRA